jgi:hypothetical protein
MGENPRDRTRLIGHPHISSQTEQHLKKVLQACSQWQTTPKTGWFACASREDIWAETNSGGYFAFEKYPRPGGQTARKG